MLSNLDNFNGGLSCTSGYFFRNRIKNNGVTAPNAGPGAKLHAACKNRPNLPITSPNLNITQFYSINRAYVFPRKLRKIYLKKSKIKSSNNH